LFFIVNLPEWRIEPTKGWRGASIAFGSEEQRERSASESEPRRG
jgi:hypothetical protein